jgi:hypothetical protein
MTLSEYEQQQLKKVNEHRPEKGSELFDKLLKVPGVGKARDSGAAVLGATAAGAGKFMTRTGQLTTSDARVIRAMARPNPCSTSTPSTYTRTPMRMRRRLMSSTS